MGYLTAQWYGNHFPCNSHHSYLDDIVDMSDHDTSNKKRSHPDTEAEEARDQPGPLPQKRVGERTAGRKKQRLCEEPRRPFASANDIPDVRERPVTPKNQRPYPTSAPVHATPMKSSISEHVQPEGEPTILDKHVKDYIKNELGTREGAIMRDYPVIDFVRNVWGFCPELIPRGATGYVLDGDLVRAYEVSEYTKTKKYTSGERNSCLAFEEIFKKMVEQIEVNKSEAGSSLPSSEFDGELKFLREMVIDGDYANFKPDYALIQKGVLLDRELHWHQPGVVGDQKKRSANRNARFRKNITIDPGKLAANKSFEAVGGDVKPQRRRRRRRRGGAKNARGPSQIPAEGSSRQADVPSNANEFDLDEENKGEPMLISSLGVDQGKGFEECGGKLGTDMNDGPDGARDEIEPSTVDHLPGETTSKATGVESYPASPKLSPSHVDTLTNDEVQMTKYLMELVSHGVRQYATGFLVEDQWISLWYGDRFGVIKSAFFNWIAEPHFLLLMVAALRFADRRRLGFSPFVAMDPNAPAENPYINATLRLSTDVNYQEHAEDATSTNNLDNRTKGKGEGKRNGSRKGQRAKGSGKAKGKSKGEVEEGVLEEEVQEGGMGNRKGKERWQCQPSPQRPTEEPLKAINVKGEHIEQTLEFPFDCGATSQRRLLTQYGLMGRGTTVIPVKVAGGQVTAIALGLEEETPLVAKLAWQHVHRHREDTFIRRIRSALDIKDDPRSQSMLKHVVTMYCSLSLPIGSSYIHLPRAFMNLLTEIHPADLREFRLLVLEAYEPLANLTSPGDFKKVFREVFEAHHWIWTKAQVLHRDISVNNIMFRICDGVVEGVLCDWDLSATKDELCELYVPKNPTGIPTIDPGETTLESSFAGENQPDNSGKALQDNIGITGAPEGSARVRQRPRYRTGTGPFMALEQLLCPAGSTPMHKYTFDVQSFFYLMCWVLGRHNPETKKIGTIDQWMKKKLDDTWVAKVKFLTFNAVQTEIFREAHASYRPLIDSWFKKLHPMFREAYLIHVDISALPDMLATARADGDEEEVRLLQAKIAAKAKEMEETLSYRRFLAKLT
ncbi:hypothetical protein K474DRAFT_484638 [Panus rudis PR-1116 ss-1]|nr:hypothetical protein K474DRAFT_484638 [Panus rudis PR-1116 ss-1]